MQGRATILTEEVGLEAPAAFERLYRTYGTAVRRHLLYLTGDPAVAEDLTQETFGRLFEHELAEAAEPLRDERAWLLTVASRLAYNHFRTQTRRVARENGVARGGWTSESIADAERVDDVLDVRRALSRLESRDRLVLMLRHSGFSYAEVAEVVGVAPSSIGTILARAQRRFREAYEGARPGVDEGK